MDNELAKKQSAVFSVKDRVIAQLGVAALLFTVAWMEWRTPSVPPFTGKLAWPKAWAFNTFGPHGIAWRGIAFGLMMLLLVFVTLSHRDRKPALRA